MEEMAVHGCEEEDEGDELDSRTGQSYMSVLRERLESLEGRS